MRIKDKKRGINPLKTKMNKGFFPNTLQKAVHQPVLCLNSIKKIRTAKVRTASPVV